MQTHSGNNCTCLNSLWLGVQSLLLDYKVLKANSHIEMLLGLGLPACHSVIWHLTGNSNP